MGFDQSKADAICTHVAEGKSLRSWCRENKFPSLATTFVWLRENPQFQEQYARAMTDRADSLQDDITEIADDPKLDPNDKRVRIDARKWIASKLNAKRYGDRVINEQDGKLEITIRDLTKG